MNYLIGLKFLFFFISSYIIFKLTIPLFNKFVIDKPVFRSLHVKPKPRGGGIVFSIFSAIFCSFQGFFWPLFNLPLSIVGFIDDIVSLPSSLRYLSQILTSIFCLKFLCELTLEIQITNPLFWICVFIFTSIINFINFMDGIDGIVALNMILIFSTVSISIKPSISPLIISLIVFLRFNYPPARIFMGDAGSTFLGSIFACFIFSAESVESSFYLYLVGFPFFADCVTCIIRRLFNNQNIFLAHKLHLYQRLYQAGIDNYKILIIYSIPTFILSYLWVNNNFHTQIYVTILTFIIGLFLDKYFAKSFKKSINNS